MTDIDAQDAQDLWGKRMACNPEHLQIRTGSSPEAAPRAESCRRVDPVNRCQPALLRNSQRGRLSCRQSWSSAFFDIGCDLVKTGHKKHKSHKLCFCAFAAIPAKPRAAEFCKRLNDQKIPSPGATPLPLTASALAFRLGLCDSLSRVERCSVSCPDGGTITLYLIGFWG